MSLPTAHNYVVKNMMESLVSLENSFLKPKHLIENLFKTEKILTETADIFRNKEFSEDLLENEKETLKLIVEKIAALEKASQNKLNWANQFSDYLQANIKRK